MKIVQFLQGLLKKATLLLSVVATYYFCTILCTFQKITKSFRELEFPGPDESDNWFLGSIPYLAKMTNSASKQNKRFHAISKLRDIYGDVVKIRLLHAKYVVLFNVNHAKMASRLPKSLNYEKVAAVLGNGLLTLNGDVWKEHRRMLSHGFTLNEFRQYFPIFQETTSRFIEVLTNELIEHKELGVVDFTHHVTCCTLDIISRAGFGFELDSLQGHNRKAQETLNSVLSLIVHPLANYCGKYGARFLRWYHRRDLRTIDEIIYTSIKRRKVESEEEKLKRNPDLLDLLLSAEVNKTKFTEKEIRDEAFIFFLAGHETTALTLQWTLALLAKHTHVLQKLTEEVDRICPFPRKLSFDKIKDLVYMKMVLQEVLRLYPPASAITRNVPDELIIEGKSIPKDTGVMIPIMAIHTDPRGWGPDSDEFNPDKNFSSEAVQKRDPMYYIPFAFGPRQCIGQQFFWVEAPVILTALIQNFKDFALINESFPAINLRRGTTHPDSPILIKMSRRN